jgi:YegS/Rv2252/BmrU family lipid kinase
MVYFIRQTQERQGTMKIQLIFNPHAGRGRGMKSYPEIHKALRKAGHEVIPHRTIYRFHATEIVKSLNLYETDILVSVGGDGTLFEVVNGLMNNPGKKIPPIAVVPVGTGNSFVKDLNIFTMEEGIKSIIRNVSRPVDVVSFTAENSQYYFINNLGFGFVADVSVSSEPMKKRGLGYTAYALGVLREVTRLRSHELTLDIDGKKYHHKANFCYFCNSIWVGGNMKISPNSVMDDGEIEIMVLNEISRRELLKTFPKVFKGTHITHPSVVVYRGKHVKASTIPEKFCNPDGEIFGVTPLEVMVLPSALQFCTLE